MEKARKIRQALRDDRAVFSLLHGLASPVAAELEALVGFDAVIVDDEHGCGGRGAQLAIAQAITAGGAAMLVRVASDDVATIGRALDLGADGLIVPGVRTVAQAEAVVRATRFAPAGCRNSGVSMARASGFGLFAADYLAPGRDGPLVCAIIESREGVAAAAAIAQVDGIDAIVIGLQDLSSDMGQAGNLTGAEPQAAMRQVEAAVRAAGKAVGTALFPGFTLADLLARGHRFITLGVDTRMLGGLMKGQLAQCREQADGVRRSADPSA